MRNLNRMRAFVHATKKSNTTVRKKLGDVGSTKCELFLVMALTRDVNEKEFLDTEGENMGLVAGRRKARRCESSLSFLGPRISEFQGRIDPGSDQCLTEAFSASLSLGILLYLFVDFDARLV